MKHSFLAILTAAMLTFGASSGYALGKGRPNSGTCTNCPNGGPKRDGTGPGMKNGQQNGQPGMHGRQTGPRDGTGPIHTPSQQGRRGRR
jgi:hypothetical protein